VDAVREPVSFAKGNVLDAGLCASRSFDVVLCRNLLIYLDPAARARALDNLCSWLVDDGLLFAGHAEAVEQMDARFQRLAESSPFAYVKHSRERADAARNQGTARGAAGARPVSSSRSRARPTTGPRPITAKDTEAVPAPQPSPRATLERATELANRGNLREARQLCERVIAENGASAEAYCLLGIIGNAAGQREDAIASFNKSLYLNPNHYEALVHLALLYEQRGEQPVAANFRRRAERARRSDGK
jgi:chemotaxis protein methyltransferase WspC